MSASEQSANQLIEVPVCVDAPERVATKRANDNVGGSDLSAPDAKRCKSADALKLRNPLPVFDDNVFQEKEAHLYFVRDITTNTFRPFNGSCTGAIAEHLPKFDRNAAYEVMVRSGSLHKKAHYRGKTREQIFEMWSEGGEEASDFGTEMHAAIEDYANGVADLEHDAVWSSVENKPSLDRFLDWQRDYIVQPGEEFGVARDPRGDFKGQYFRTELSMFDADYEFAGQADVLIEMPDGSFVLGDWKRTKENLGNLVRRDNGYYDAVPSELFAGHALPHQQAFNNNRGFRMLSRLPAVKVTKFIVQASLYALCIMKFNPHIRITRFRLGIFHPNNASYVWLPIEPLFDEARAMLEWRRQQRLRLYTQTLLTTLPPLSALLSEVALAVPEYEENGTRARQSYEAALNLARILFHHQKQQSEEEQ